MLEVTFNIKRNANQNDDNLKREKALADEIAKVVEKMVEEKNAEDERGMLKMEIEGDRREESQKNEEEDGKIEEKGIVIHKLPQNVHSQIFLQDSITPIMEYLDKTVGEFENETISLYLTIMKSPEMPACVVAVSQDVKNPFTNVLWEDRNTLIVSLDMNLRTLKTMEGLLPEEYTRELTKEFERMKKIINDAK